MKHKGQHGSCIATRATQWAPEREQTFSSFILDHQKKKADSKYSSTRAISMQMISFSQNYNQPTQHFAFHLTADRIKLNGVPKVSQRLRISCCFMHIGERLNRIKRKKNNILVQKSQSLQANKFQRK